MKAIRLSVPCPISQFAELHSGEQVLISGTLYAARDEAHKRLIDLKKSGKPLPVDLKNQIIYYVGPSPAHPGQVIGSAGPTTAKRMDKYTADILELGVVGMIGKGERGEETKQLLKGKAVYFAALGGIGAKLSKCIVRQEVVAFEDAGMEALRKLEVVDFPVIVIHDLDGNDAYYDLHQT